jgi:hypothetical protein
MMIVMAFGKPQTRKYNLRSALAFVIFVSILVFFMVATIKIL